MPRFYFDIYNIKGFLRDDFGDIFVSFEEAREQAQSLLPDIAREELPDGEIHEIMCQVRNEASRIVYRAKLTLRAEVVDEAVC